MLQFAKNIVVVGAIFFSFVTAVLAEPMTWHIRSDYTGTIHLQLYAYRDSSNWIWPDPDQVYIIESRRHAYSIDCNKGENICYGAWTKENSSIGWGTGYQGLYSCSNCCYRCGSGDVTLNLTVR